MQESAKRVLDSFCELTDNLVPGLIDGVYLVGSLALDDFHEGASDIDFVAVLSQEASPDQLVALAEVHRTLTAQFPQPYFDGLYLTRSELAKGPHTSEPTPSAHEHRFTERSTFAQDPVTWHTLARHDVLVRGVPTKALEIWHDEDALVDWVLSNVSEYWKPWLRGHSRLLSPGGLSALRAEVAVWGVLGIARMSYTVTTGDITSKRGAGEHAKSAFDPRWHRIIDECLRLRSATPAGSLYRSALARRRDALAFVAMAINDLGHR